IGSVGSRRKHFRQVEAWPVNGTTLGGKMDFTAPNAVTEPGQKLLLVTFHQHWIAPNTHQRHQSFVLFELPQKPFRPFRNSGDPSDLGERSPDKQGSGICQQGAVSGRRDTTRDRKSTRLNSSHVAISYAVFCLKKKKKQQLNT